MEEFKFNGFRYYASYEQGILPGISHNSVVSEYLYKYYSINEYNVDALANSHFYASHPFELNDILDSSLLLFFASQPLQFRVYENLYKNFESHQQLLEFYQEDLNNACSNYILTLYSLVSDRFGVISISDNVCDELMWPHYTQEKGFKIKFKTEILSNSIKEYLPANGRFVGLYPINYTDRIKPIDICMFKRFDIPFIYSTNIKSNKWKYENEWRFIVSKPGMGVPFSKLGFSEMQDHKFKPDNRYISYDLASIEAICLGFNFFAATDFHIQRNGEKEYKVRLLNRKKDEKKYSYYVRFLDFLMESLGDRIYLSNVKYEMDHDKTSSLIRSKERVIIEKIDNLNYKLTRREEAIKM